MIFLLLFASFIINILFLYFELYPFLKRRLTKNQYCGHEPLDIYEKKVYNATRTMLNSDLLFMSMVEKRDFISWISSLLKGNNSRTFKQYSYPRAFLFWGALRFTSIKGTKEEFLRIKGRFDKLFLTKDGHPNFQIDKVDQTVFAQAALELYKQTGEEKYRNFADSIYNYLLSIKSNTGIILYRSSSATQYVDLLGMICPFLIEYGLLFEDEESLNLAYIHMNYWIEKGIDNQSHLPFHCIHLDTSTRVGPTNWGRGIGWYGLALAYIVSKTNETINPYYNLFSSEFNLLKITLLSLKNNDSLWGQFPGNPIGNGLYFDASASLTYLYMNALTDKNVNYEYSISKYILKDGFIDFTSGDTEGINQYSRVYSKSEYSQGMLLLYLSELEQHKK